MGVKTIISLDELNRLFPSYNFIGLLPTTSGVIDTTYIASTSKEEYILKRYERDISAKIDENIKLLRELKSIGLNTPTCISQNSLWYLYEKLQGEEPKSIRGYHIQELARFLAKLHNHTSRMDCQNTLLEKNEIRRLLNYAKSNYFAYYKRLEFLKNYVAKKEGLIHGDIFKDNTVFNGRKIAVFDFIDSTSGGFAFDAAVALLGFDIKKRNTYFLNIFTNCYNQTAAKKLDKKELIKELRTASALYALKRINNHKNTKKAKELL